jgi:prophage maintenance system killer protein
MVFSEEKSEKIIKEMLKSFKEFEDGVSMLGELSKMQLFPNGNKRTALCFANLCLLKKDLQIIQINNRNEYLNKLVDFYDNSKKKKEFIEYVKKDSQLEKKK